MNSQATSQYPDVRRQLDEPHKSVVSNFTNGTKQVQTATWSELD